MLTAIQLNDKFSARSTKVGDVVADGVLWAEVDIAHAMRAQMGMEFAFVRSHVAAQLFGALEDFGRGAFMHFDPPPHPALPQLKNTIGGGFNTTWEVIYIFIIISVPLPPFVQFGWGKDGMGVKCFRR